MNLEVPETRPSKKERRKIPRLHMREQDPQQRAGNFTEVNLGFTEAVASMLGTDGHYTFWDYQAGAWQKDNGIRIDHLLLSPEAANMFGSASIEKHVRAWEKPSDHVPVAVDLTVRAA